MKETHMKNKKICEVVNMIETHMKNKELCERYPFLIPRAGYEDKPIWEVYDDIEPYECTWFDDLPRGWRKAFGILICEEIRDELIKWDFLDKYRVAQIKEKYGQLRWYDNGVPNGCRVEEIIDEYSHLSENICIWCGKPDVYMLNMGGWLSPYCFDCFCEIHKDDNYSDNELKELYDKYICDDSPIMSNTYSVSKYSNGKSETITYDISKTAQKIRDYANYVKQLKSEKDGG